MFVVILKSIVVLFAMIVIVGLAFLMLIFISYVLGVIVGSLGLVNAGTRLKTFSKNQSIRVLNSFKLKGK